MQTQHEVLMVSLFFIKLRQNVIFDLFLINEALLSMEDSFNIYKQSSLCSIPADFLQ